MSYIDAEKVNEMLGGARRVIYLDKTGSTNTDLLQAVKEGRLDTGDIIIAGVQSGGRGRCGKSFASPPSGIYFSFCTDNIEYGLATVMCALAVSSSLRTLGCEALIKWVNDIYAGGKKLCGILAQSAGDGSRAVIGVGINLVAADIPPELREKAGALDEFGVFGFSKEALTASVVSEYERLSRENAECGGERIISEYARRLCHMGKKVTVLSTGETATTVGVGTDGSLIVENGDGERKALSSGEISIIINS